MGCDFFQIYFWFLWKVVVFQDRPMIQYFLIYLLSLKNIYPLKIYICRYKRESRGGRGGGRERQRVGRKEREGQKGGEKEGKEKGKEKGKEERELLFFHIFVYLF